MASQGSINSPDWVPSFILCNGQIAPKVDAKSDLAPTDNPKTPSSNYVKPSDTSRNLLALNSLQTVRRNGLLFSEVYQPLTHVLECLPDPVQERIGISGEDFCKEVLLSPNMPHEKFTDKIYWKFGKTTLKDGYVEYKSEMLQIRTSEYFFWIVEIDKGEWMAIIAHLEKSDVPNPAKASHPKDDSIPATVPSEQYNTVQSWSVVTTATNEDSYNNKAIVELRFREILRLGDIAIPDGSERQLWTPPQSNGDDYSSGLRVFHLIKEQMHRITEFYCRELPFQESFWEPHRGWLDVDEVRGEMMGRAAQGCLADLNYLARIAIEGVHRKFGKGEEEPYEAIRLRPTKMRKRAYVPGNLTKEGHGIESKGFGQLGNDSSSSTKPQVKTHGNKNSSLPIKKPSINPPEDTPTKTNNAKAAKAAKAAKGWALGKGWEAKNYVTKKKGQPSAATFPGMYGLEKLPYMDDDPFTTKPSPPPPTNNNNKNTTNNKKNTTSKNTTNNKNTTTGKKTSPGKKTATGKKATTIKKKRPAEDDLDAGDAKKLMPRRYREATFLKTDEDIKKAQDSLKEAIKDSMENKSDEDSPS